MTLSPVYSVDVHTYRSLLIGGVVHDPPIGVGRRFSCECQPSSPKQSVRIIKLNTKFVFVLRDRIFINKLKQKVKYFYIMTMITILTLFDS
ncbi:unnamed protein product, partial [Heterotrigona itama]